MLDELMNHLDNSMTDWLKEYLQNWKGGEKRRLNLLRVLMVDRTR